MKLGVIQQVGTPDEIYNNPVNLFVAGFLGSPNMNLLNGRLGVVDGVPHFVGDTLSLPLSHVAGAAGVTDGREVVLGVRPEQVLLQTERSELTPYSARISLVEPLGSQNIVWLAVNERLSLAVVKDSAWSGLQGDAVHWGVTPDRVSLFDAQSEQRI
jgi:multiple sugar transport system ATP-binding protein